MTSISPQELANLWYLKFGDGWIVRTHLPQEWKDIGRELMRNNLADYEMINYSARFSPVEIIKLKETCK